MIILSVGIFVAVVGLHSFLHRYLLGRGILTTKSALVHIIGFGTLLILWNKGLLPLPVSSVVVYGLLATLETQFYLAVVLGGEAPASRILASYQTREAQSEKQLMDLFTTRNLIWKRISDLVRAGLVKQRRGKLVAALKGRTLARVIGIYQIIFNRRMRG